MGFLLLTFRQNMEAIFYSDTLEEWLEENVNEHIERLHNMVVDVERIIKLHGQPKVESSKKRWNGQVDQQERHYKTWHPNFLLCFSTSGVLLVSWRLCPKWWHDYEKLHRNYTVYALLEEVDYTMLYAFICSYTGTANVFSMLISREGTCPNFISLTCKLYLCNSRSTNIVQFYAVAECEIALHVRASNKDTRYL